MIDDRSRVTISAVLMPLVSWRAELEPQAPIAYQLMEGGRARIVRDAVYRDACRAAEKEPGALARLSLTMFPGQWAKDNRITLPGVLAAHVLGGGLVEGPVFLWVRGDCFEVWSVARRLLETEDVQRDLAAHLPD